MVEDNVNEHGESVHEVVGSNSGVEAKRNKIRFKRATVADSDSAFSGSESQPRRSKRIPNEKRSTVSIGDSRPEVSNTVKGKAPSIPPEESESPKRKGRPPSKAKLTLEDASNNAKFLLTAIEVACVTSIGPTGEMTEWERGLMQAPLQRILARFPVAYIEKGGIFVDCAFLIMGSAIYFGRVSKGIKLPVLSGKKRAQVQTQEDPQSPVAAQPHLIVDDIKAGDRDGLAVPIPTIIQEHMNGPI